MRESIVRTEPKKCFVPKVGFSVQPISHFFSVFGVRFKLFMFRSKPKASFLKWWKCREKIKVFTIMSSRYNRHCGEQSGRCRHLGIIWRLIQGHSDLVSWHEIYHAEPWTVYKMKRASALPSRSQCSSAKYCSSSFGCLSLAPEEKSKSHLLTFINVQLFKPK